MNIPLITRFKNVIALVALSLPILMLALLAPQVSANAIITVDSNLDDNDPTTCTLREAVEAANTDSIVNGCDAGDAGADTIQFDASTDGLTMDIGTLGEITISSDLTIEGNGTSNTLISGSNQSRIFFINAGTVVDINDVTISDGEATIVGFDDHGGAIYNDGGELVIRDSALENNNADDRGGVILNANGGEITVMRSEFNANSADTGAAIANNDGLLDIKRTSFVGNDARIGGAIFDNPLPGIMTTLAVNKSLFDGNTATYGGALYLNPNSDSDITNSTFSGNSVTNSGAAISVMGANADINFSTFTGNTGTDGTIFTGVGGTANLLASILNDTTNCAGVGTFVTFGDNVENASTCAIGPNDLANTDPMLDTLQLNLGGETMTHALLVGSPAVDLVALADCSVSFDQNDTARPLGAACDAGAFELDAPVVVVIDPVASDDAAVTDENVAVLIDVLANDTDADGTIDATTVVITNAANNGTLSVDAVTGEITYTPNAGFVGADQFTYTVDDNDGNTSNEATVTITVNAVVPGNVAPVATDDTAVTDENVAVLIDVLANDTDSDGTVDATTVTIVDQPLDGTVSVDAVTGEVTYTPDAGFVGVDQFTYTVDDNDGDTSNLATVDVTINAVVVPNVAPVAVDDAANVDENSNVLVDVLANDSDSDGTLDPATLTIVDQPLNGTLTVNPVFGTVTYTPLPGFVGADSFTYTVDDNDGDTSNLATVDITVDALPVGNIAPVANDDADTTDENTDVLVDVLANDTDADGTVDATTVTVVSTPLNGSVSVDGTTGEVTYTPNLGFVGVDAFTYTVEDDQGAVSNTATVLITVDALPNVTPVANDDSASTDEDLAVLIDVTDNDTDSDGYIDTTTVTIVAQPSNGTVNVNSISGAVTYTPDSGFFGTDQFTYTVNDEDGTTSNVATVNITVVEDGSNIAPVANDDTVLTDEDRNVDVDITANDFDTDGSLDITSIDVTDGPFNGSVSINASNGVATYNPYSNFSGIDVFQYTIEDNEGLVSNVATVTVEVLNVDNDAPEAEDDDVDGEKNEEILIDILRNDDDDKDEIDASTVDITDYPNHGDIDVNSTTGVVTYDPDLNYEGIDTFEYTVEDEDGNVSNEAKVTIEVDEDGVIITGEDVDQDCYFHPFVDITNHWVEDAVEGFDGLYCRNVVEGRDGTHYVPNNDVTRAEFLTILLRNLNIDILSYEDEGEDFEDVNSTKWYYAYVVTGLELEIIDDEDFFRPNDEINRAEATAMMVRVVELTEDLRNPSDDEPFDDVDDRKWYGDVIAVAYDNDLIQGYSNGDFRPGNDLSRAEAAEMANNIYEEFYQ